MNLLRAKAAAGFTPSTFSVAQVGGAWCILFTYPIDTFLFAYPRHTLFTYSINTPYTHISTNTPSDRLTYPINSPSDNESYQLTL